MAKRNLPPINRQAPRYDPNQAAKNYGLGPHHPTQGLAYNKTYQKKEHARYFPVAKPVFGTIAAIATVLGANAAIQAGGSNEGRVPYLNLPAQEQPFDPGKSTETLPNMEHSSLRLKLGEKAVVLVCDDQYTDRVSGKTTRNNVVNLNPDGTFRRSMEESVGQEYRLSLSQQLPNESPAGTWYDDKGKVELPPDDPADCSIVRASVEAYKSGENTFLHLVPTETLSGDLITGPLNQPVKPNHR